MLDNAPMGGSDDLAAPAAVHRPTPLILRNNQAPGDVVMLTALVRDIHLCYPGRFITDVRTPYPELWANNPYVSDLDEDDKTTTIIDCKYPLIYDCHKASFHFLQGFIDDLNTQLGLSVRLSRFCGDIHLDEDDKVWPRSLAGLVEEGNRYWLVVNGGKYDYTTKWWDPLQMQMVVDHFKGRIRFVQVGRDGDYHPQLADVIDIRGKTDLRELIRVVYHADGVLTPVSLHMHLAAAVETLTGGARPCVVVAGGREPPQWEAYPTHQFIHTIGALTCCEHSGCWKARAYPLGDGDEKDSPEHLCRNLSGAQPRCMELITSDEVIARIKRYYRGGVLVYKNYVPAVDKSPIQPPAPETETLTPETADALSLHYLSSAHTPAIGDGRGIVICGGGKKYFPCAWVCIRMLRRLGCRLPIELWYLGPLECDLTMQHLIQPYGVTCVDGRRHRRMNERLDWDLLQGRGFGGFALKSYAILHSAFAEILFIDADNVPVVDPTFLFETPEYQKYGAIFWPDYERMDRNRDIWQICNVPYRDEPEFESGQFVIDKSRHLQPLTLAFFYNANSEFYYQYIHGDKDTFHLAFRRIGHRYAMPQTGIYPLDYTMCQHDFSGRRIFQHRNLAKWRLHQPNLRIHGFEFEQECLDFLEGLATRWDGRIEPVSGENGYARTRLSGLSDRLTRRPYRYHRIGYDTRLMSFQPNGLIGFGAADWERYWEFIPRSEQTVLEIGSVDKPICNLKLDPSGVWRGHWLAYEKMPVELIPA